MRAFEKVKGGVLFVEWYERAPAEGKGKRRRMSLRHRDQAKAKETADELAAAFIREELSAALRRDTGEITLADLIDLYLARETPYKSRSKQGHDRRAAAAFKTFFGTQRKAESLNLGDWNGFIRARRERRIGPPETVFKADELRTSGKPVPPLGYRQIEYHLRFLWAVLNWATKAGDDHGSALLARNPLKECVHARSWPREKNPERPGLTQEQYLALVEVAPGVDWRFHVALVLAHETGHRVGSIRKLRWSDLQLDEGWVRWRQENDKAEWEHRTPLSEDAGGALRIAERHRLERTGDDAWVFPSPRDPTRPCSRNIMRDWWNEAQEEAGLSGVRRLGWHSLRRKFANDLRHVPLKDLACLGGWKDTQTLLKCYLKEDERAMVEALRSRNGQKLRPAENDGGEPEE